MSPTPERHQAVAATAGVGGRVTGWGGREEVRVNGMHSFHVLGNKAVTEYGKIPHFHQGSVLPRSSLWLVKPQFPHLENEPIVSPLQVVMGVRDDISAFHPYTHSLHRPSLGTHRVPGTGWQ